MRRMKMIVIAVVLLLIMVYAAGIAIDAKAADDTWMSEEEFWDELELLAIITLAEAENQSELGQRLVIDVILNRIEDSRFPDTVSGCVYQKGQFTSAWNGRMNRVELNENICALVLEEIEERTNTEVLYFNTGGYPSWATPVLKEGAHYFSRR